jgi:hypothetical protein
MHGLFLTVDPSVRRLQVRQRLGSGGGPGGLRRLQRHGPRRRFRRRRHHVPPRPPRLLLLHQRRAGPLRGRPAPRCPRHGAPRRLRARTGRPRASRGDGAAEARPRRVRRRRRVVRLRRHGRWVRRRGCPRQPRHHVSVISWFACCMCELASVVCLGLGCVFLLLLGRSSC